MSLSFKSLPIVSVIILSGSALLTVTAACSSSSSGDPTNASDDDAGKDATVKETGPIDDDSGNEEAVCPQTTPITAADIESVIDWLPPAPVQSVCSQKNIDDLKAVFTAGGGTATFANIKTALGETCSACAFTQITAMNWGVFIESDAGILDNSTAACFAEVDNNNCGKAVFEFSGCLNIACNTNVCADANAIKACKTKAASGACKDLNTAVSTQCKALQTDVGFFYEGLESGQLDGKVSTDLETRFLAEGGRALAEDFIALPQHGRRAVIDLAHTLASVKGVEVAA